MSSDLVLIKSLFLNRMILIGTPVTFIIADGSLVTSHLSFCSNFSSCSTGNIEMRCPGFLSMTSFMNSM